MSANSAGNVVDIHQLDADDRALHARFIALEAEAQFEWPDRKELSGKGGKADKKRRRRNRDGRNGGRLEALEASTASSEAALVAHNEKCMHDLVHNLVAGVIANVQDALREEAMATRAGTSEARVSEQCAQAESKVDALLGSLRSAVHADLRAVRGPAHGARLAGWIETRVQCQVGRRFDRIPASGKHWRRVNEQLRDSRAIAVQQRHLPAEWEAASLANGTRFKWSPKQIRSDDDGPRLPQNKRRRTNSSQPASDESDASSDDSEAPFPAYASSYDSEANHSDLLRDSDDEVYTEDEGPHVGLYIDEHGKSRHIELNFYFPFDDALPRTASIFKLGGDDRLGSENDHFEDITQSSDSTVVLVPDVERPPLYWRDSTAVFVTLTTSRTYWAVVAPDGEHLLLHKCSGVCAREDIVINTASKSKAVAVAAAARPPKVRKHPLSACTRICNGCYKFAGAAYASSTPAGVREQKDLERGMRLARGKDTHKKKFRLCHDPSAVIVPDFVAPLLRSRMNRMEPPTTDEIRGWHAMRSAEPVSSAALRAVTLTHACYWNSKGW